MCLPDGTSAGRRPVVDKGSEASKEDAFQRKEHALVREGKRRTEDHDDVVLWGFRITCLTPQQQLCVLGAAMFFCHVLQGILTEHVAKGVLSGLMWAAAAIELSVYSMLSCIELKMTRASFNIRTMPWKAYISIATCSISVGRIGLIGFIVVTQQ